MLGVGPRGVWVGQCDRGNRGGRPRRCALQDGAERNPRRDSARSETSARPIRDLTVFFWPLPALQLSSPRSSVRAWPSGLGPLRMTGPGAVPAGAEQVVGREIGVHGSTSVSPDC
jgi:hypothetical protein